MSKHEPKPLASERDAYWRVVGMAQATDTDVEAAFEAGELTAEGWADIIGRCRSCRWAKGCDQWLAADDGARRAVPQACLNSATFEALQPERKPKS
ncbi:MAG: DUF6455 family protein [Pseudomonadota bacterium]